MAPAEPRYMPDVVMETAFALSAAGMACSVEMLSIHLMPVCFTGPTKGDYLSIGSVAFNDTGPNNRKIFPTRQADDCWRVYAC